MGAMKQQFNMTSHYPHLIIYPTLSRSSLSFFLELLIMLYCCTGDCHEPPLECEVLSDSRGLSLGMLGLNRFCELTILFTNTVLFYVMLHSHCRIFGRTDSLRFIRPIFNTDSRIGHVELIATTRVIG